MCVCFARRDVHYAFYQFSSGVVLRERREDHDGRVLFDLQPCLNLEELFRERYEEELEDYRAREYVFGLFSWLRRVRPTGGRALHLRLVSRVLSRFSLLLFRLLRS